MVNAEIFHNLKDVSILVPTEDSLMETGARRGTAYLVGGKMQEGLMKLIEDSLSLKLLKF